MYKYIILGVIQGLTEFLPISSSGHLVIAQKLFGLTEDFIFLDVVLHLGTLLAVIIFFYRDIHRIVRGTFKGISYILKGEGLSQLKSEQRTDFKTGIYILIVTFVTAVIVGLGKNFFEGIFSSSRVTVIALAVTGLVLLATSRFAQGKRNFSQLNPKDAILVGLAQAIAVIPGLSRSGLTISVSLFRNIKRDCAFRFSFLASILAISGAMVFKLHKISAYSASQWLALGAGFLTAFLSGLAGLIMLKKIIQKAKFAYFGYYCLAAAILIWLLGKA